MAGADPEAAHQALLDSLPLPCVAADLSGRILRWNRRYEELVGLPAERLRGATLLDVLSTPEARDVLAKGMGEIWAGRSFVTEYSTPRPGGEPADFRLHVSPLRDASGALVGTQALVEEVTGPARLARALVESEERYRDLYENAPVAYFVLDRQLRFARVNRRYVDLLGLEPEQVAPGSDGRAAVRINAEIERGLARIETEVFGEGRLLTLEFPLQRLDGKERWVRAQMNPLRGPDGCVVGVRGLLEDLTEIHQARAALAESEGELRDLYENAPLAYYVLSLEGRLLRWNGRVAEFFGVDPSVLRVGMPVQDLIRPTPQAEAAIADTFETIGRGQPFSIELEYVRLDGEPRWVRSHARPVRDRDGAIVALSALTEDITEIRRAEQELRETDARLASIVDSATDAIVSFDAEGHILLFNRGAEQILRCGAREALGLPVARFGTEESLAVLRTLVTRLDADPGARLFVSAEQGVRSRRLDGTTFVTEATFSRSTAGGKALYTTIFRDADERRAQTEELERLRGESEYFREELRQVHQFDDIVGRSPALAATLAQVSRVAPTGSTVLILGETGTGKEMIARAIHARSQRAERPLVKLNCAAVPAGLVESELFGHEKGAFTGATERRTGRFELANGGTIFLDEIGELPLDTQAKLLRVLQEREFERVGGSQTLVTDVRVIAATNRDLAAMVEAGRFRADLYYRLDVFPVTLPPLRERPEDIPLLANFFVARYAPKIGRAATVLTARAAERLTRYGWPGNVRELENVIERALIVASPTAPELDVPAKVLPLAASPADAARAPEMASPGAPEAPPAATRPGSSRLEEIERAHILATLDASGWRIEGERGAAIRLGLKPSTLRSRMAKLGIRRER